MADSRNSAQVTINDRFDVIADEPLPEFDCGTALAYRVRHHRDSSLSLFGLVCDPRLPIRLDKFSAISRIESPYLMRLNDWGIADWPLSNSQCPILVFERPSRGKLFGALDQEIEPRHEDFVIKHVVQPVYDVLREFREVGVAHRNIRPDNVFIDGVGEGNMILGQCLSSSPGFEQPFICETIESCMALPTASGPGMESDDMYSLGVVLAAMITGAVPGAGMSDQEILDAKLSEGSAAMMTRGGRISLSMMEGLRGLLNDDADERWTLDDLGQWANGKRGSPIQASPPMRASRAFEFGGRNLSNCREVGNAMSKNWNQAAAVIHDGSLDSWLRRALGDSNMVEAVGIAKTDLTPNEMENDDIVVGRVCIALDPMAPIRFRDLSVTVDGFEGLLSDLDGNRPLLGQLAQMLGYNFVNFWIENQSTSRTDLVERVRTLNQLRDILRRTAIGEGFERALYEFNPSMPCLSPILDREYAIDAAQVMPALEHAAARRTDLRALMDRHLAAFLSTRFGGLRGGEFRNMDNEVDPYLPLLAGVRVLDLLQSSTQPVHAYPELCKCATRLIAPSIKRFHSRVTRKRVEEEMQRAEKTGILSEVLDAIDNPVNLSNDARDYQYAVLEYGQTIQRLLQLDMDRKNRSLIARNLGAQVSSVISGFLMTIVSILIVIYYFLIKG